MLFTIQIGAEDDVRNGWAEIEGDGTLRRLRVPILMYHYVSPLPPDADDIRIGLTLDPVIFRQHLAYLADNGYNTVSLYEIDDALENGTPLPENPVVLTFDDGYIDHYVYVFPMLQEYGLTGTFFIISQFADDSARGFMSWTQIQEMAAAGMSMQAHTRTHSDLRERDFDFLVYEIVGSMESVAAHSSRDAAIFSYPVGRYDENTLNVIATTGVERAVTTQLGAWHTTDNRFEVSRMRVTEDTEVSGLIHLLNYGR